MFTEKMISPPAVATVDDFSASILTRPQVSRSVPRLLPPRPRLCTFTPSARGRWHGFMAGWANIFGENSAEIFLVSQCRHGLQFVHPGFNNWVGKDHHAMT